MKEQFVPYEIALALKELGFDEECLYAWCQVKGGYTETGGDKWLDEYKMRANGNPFGAFSEGVDYNNITGNNKNRIQCSAPLYQQVEQWLREKHGIEIELYRTMEDDNGNNGYGCSAIRWKEWSTDKICNLYGNTPFETREFAILEAIKLLKGEKK